MFTGLVEAVGEVERIEQSSGGLRLKVSAPELIRESAPAEGASIAVEGVCLTAVEILEDGFWTDVSGETLDCTTLGGFEVGTLVNLEGSLKVGEELGGHFVFGHVDGVATIKSFEEVGEGRDLVVRFPDEFNRYIARKGSVALDGISLTVNGVEGNTFTVRIIPHTFTQTTLSEKSPGDTMNFEVDMLARYVERSITTRDSSAKLG